MAFFAATGIAIWIILAIAFVVLLIIANWKIFTKAGQGGWKSLIPIYNSYITYKIAWKPSMFWITLLISILAVVFCLMRTSWLMYVGWGCAIADLILMILFIYKFAKSFGHGVGYTIGLIFLPNIFTLILGFNKDEYLGPQ